MVDSIVNLIGAVWVDWYLITGGWGWRSDFRDCPELARLLALRRLKRSMIKLFCGMLAGVILACGLANAVEPPMFEVRTRSAIGRLGLVRVQLTTKAEADGSVVVSFQAPDAGTYVLNYTSGPKAGKVAATVRVEKAGPVTTKVKSP